jgi:hypothetical protein
MALTTQPVSPKATPLPPLPSEDPLTAAQWKTLLAMADAIIPTIKPMATARAQIETPATQSEYSTAIGSLMGLASEPDSEALATAYLEESASSNPAFRQAIHRFLAFYMPQASRNQLIFVLNVLG